MPKRQSKPGYWHHKPSGQAYVRIDRKDIYLGAYGSSESRSRYAELIEEWLDRHRVDRHTLSIAELCLRYHKHVQTHYVKNGRPTSEQLCIKSALRPLVRLFGTLRAADFGPVKLGDYRDCLIEAKYAISTIRKHVFRVRHLFKWAVSRELVDVATYQSLMTLGNLEAGRCAARVPEPVTPVAEAHIEATKRAVSDSIAGLIDFQVLTGARPGEACAVRMCDINTSGAVWEYTPQSHKTEHRGKQRRIMIGPKCQTVIRRHMTTDTTAPLFPNRAGKQYAVHGYRTIIRRACVRIGIPIWRPNQLRHTAATIIRRHGGIEDSRVVLGHASAVTSEVYAEKDLGAARAIVAQIG